MRPVKIKVFGPRIMLAMLLAAFATFAQDADDLEPRVDTSAALESAEEATPGSEENERDEVEPAVSSAVLANDVTRQEGGGQVMDRLELGTTQVTGNAELPTVLVIVPWQKSDPGDLTGKPLKSLIEEVLTPLDREEFVRQVDYYGELHEESSSEQE